MRSGDSAADLCGARKLKYHFESSLAANGDSAGVTGLDAGEAFAIPLDSRCFFAGGSFGVAGDGNGGPDRCMNFMPASREDITLLGRPLVAIVLIDIVVTKMEKTFKNS